MHLPILLEETHVVHGHFNSQNQTKLVVHRERDGTYDVFEPCAQPTPIEAIAHLAAIVAVQFLSEESGDVRGFDRVNQGFHAVGIERLQVALPLEDQVGRTLRDRLVDAPRIGEIQALDHRTKWLGTPI